VGSQAQAQSRSWSNLGNNSDTDMDMGMGMDMDMDMGEGDVGNMSCQAVFPLTCDMYSYVRYWNRRFYLQDCLTSPLKPPPNASWAEQKYLVFEPGKTTTYNRIGYIFMCWLSVPLSLPRVPGVEGVRTVCTFAFCPLRNNPLPLELAACTLSNNHTHTNTHAHKHANTNTHTHKHTHTHTITHTITHTHTDIGGWNNKRMALGKVIHMHVSQ
jgi:hypothetical protein